MTANKGLDEELEMEKLWSLDSFIHSISTDFQCGMLGKRCHWFHRHFRYWWHSLLYNVATGLRYFHYNRLPMTISFDIFFLNIFLHVTAVIELWNSASTRLQGQWPINRSMANYRSIITAYFKVKTYFSLKMC